uniref:Uncharacterized protein n=1 Tax=Romanomermis culicivorax TaxID=13658 RepID=A0A915KC04_ROMCU
MDVFDFLDDLNEDGAQNLLRIHTFLDTSNLMEEYSDEKFWLRYKLNKDSTRELILLLENDLTMINRGFNIPPALQIQPWFSVIVQLICDDKLLSRDVVAS